MTRVLIIGAGCSGFTTAKRLRDEGIAFDWFELSDRIGGNWAYGNPNGRSAAYQSLHIDTSKWRLQFEDFPCPPDWPDFPHHSLINGYFNAYVDHFGLRPLVRFNSEVVSVRQREDGRWIATVRTLSFPAGGGVGAADGGGGASDAPSVPLREPPPPAGEDSAVEHGPYTHVAVCNGHHWSPNIPDIPGHFEGHEMHARDYKTPFDPVDCIGKTVVVVGLGNTAVDIASELGQRPIAGKLIVSARRSVWVLPKYMNGQPMDKAIAPGWMPIWLKRKLGARMVKKLVGDMQGYGLPKPDHEPLEAHPTVSSEFLLRLGNGDITVKPIVTEKQGRTLRFADGTEEAVDVLIYATGYKLSFPFLQREDVALRDNHLPLFKRMVQPEPRLHGLWFMGLAQPLPTLVNFAEQQSKLLAAHLAGRYALPSEAEMRRIIAADEAEHQGHYYKSQRHTIQVDFDRYRHDLHAELAAGARRERRQAA